MAKFVLTLETDDEMTDALFGQPMTAEGLKVGLEAAFVAYGATVADVADIADLSATSRFIDDLEDLVHETHAVVTPDEV